MLISSLVDHIIHIVVASTAVTSVALSLQPENDTLNSWLWMTLATYSLLLLYHIFMSVAHINFFRVPVYRLNAALPQDSTSVETTVGKTLRNALGMVGLITSMVALALSSDVTAWYIILIVVAVLKRFGDTFLDFETIQQTLEPECMEYKGYNDILYTVLIHGVLAASLAIHVIKKIDGNDDLDPTLTVLDWVAISLIGLHLLLHPLVSIIVATPWNDSIVKTLTFFSTKDNKCDVLKPGNVSDGRTILVSLNRIPIIRQAIVTLILSLQAYVYGSMTTNTHFQSAALFVYAFADILGRNVL